MISNPDQIHYACIARGTTVLAELNSKDTALGGIAAKCLEITPSFHATFTHTVRSNTYTFLIDEPFVYFVIFDDKLENSEGLAFLKSVRDAFARVSQGERKLEKLTSHCFQGEFNLVFRQLLPYHMDGIESPVGQRIDENDLSKSTPIRERALKSGLVSMNRRNGDKEDDENGIGLSREFMHKSGELTGQQKAKKVWKKQMLLILCVDFVVCAILFGVWLWVCSGLKCMHN